MRMRDRAEELTRRAARDIVEPLCVEAVLAQRFVLEPDSFAFLFVAGEAVAPGTPKGVTGELGQPVERVVRPSPEGRGALRAVRLASDVVPGGASGEREAAVAAARSLRDTALIVHANAQAGLGEAECGGAARDARADDGDVGPTVELRLRPRRALFLQPVRIHEARRYMPSRTTTRPSSSSSMSVRAISSAARPVLRTSSSALAGRCSRRGDPSWCAGFGSIPNEARTSAAR